MKHLILTPLVSLLLGVAPAAYGVPSLNVIVSDASGRGAFKGATDANGTFATGHLQPGKYVVEFKSRSTAVMGNDYALVVSAGKKKVLAVAVPGIKFAAGGVAMRVDVGRGLKITGQVVNGDAVMSGADPNVKVIKGHRYVWVKSDTGSNLGGHWIEEGLGEARNVVRYDSENIRKVQDRTFEGSMLNRMEEHYELKGD